MKPLTLYLFKEELLPDLIERGGLLIALLFTFKIFNQPASKGLRNFVPYRNYRKGDLFFQVAVRNTSLEIIKASIKIVCLSEDVNNCLRM